MEPKTRKVLPHGFLVFSLHFSLPSLRLIEFLTLPLYVIHKIHCMPNSFHSSIFSGPTNCQLLCRYDSGASPWWTLHSTPLQEKPLKVPVTIVFALNSALWVEVHHFLFQSKLHCWTAPAADNEFLTRSRNLCLQSFFLGPSFAL